MENRNVITNEKEVAYTFNRYFINVADDLTKKLGNTDADIYDYLKDPTTNSFFISPTSREEILDILNEQDPNKAGAFYKISPKYAIDSRFFLSDVLCKLFNKSVDENKFPEYLKLAEVAPVHKGKSKMNHVNYRPISILHIFRKVIEKLMYNRLSSFILKNKILFPMQYGFQEDKSTELAINALLNKVTEALDNKMKSYSVFLDFAKAFDTVNHNILLKKLEYYGIRGSSLEWFESYLTNRKQCVKIGNTHSDTLTVKCGVPQGSILGPLLFLIYINDIVKSSNILQFTLFADDTCIFYSSKPNLNIENTLNNELMKVSDWLIANKLSLNVNKSSFLTFSSNKKELKLNLRINKEILNEKDHAKYLGILIDKNLNWKQHINEVKLRLSKGCAILSKIRNFVPKTILRSLYFAFIESNANYCLLNWGTAAKSNLNSIEISLKKAIRIISFRECTYHANTLFKELKILPFRDVYKLSLSKFMWKLHNCKLPEPNTNPFKIIQHSHNIRQKTLSTLQIPSVRLNIAKRHTSHQGPLIWMTDIPTNVKASKTLKSFSNSYQKHLLDNLT